MVRRNSRIMTSGGTINLTLTASVKLNVEFDTLGALLCTLFFCARFGFVVPWLIKGELVGDQRFIFLTSVGSHFDAKRIASRIEAPLFLSLVLLKALRLSDRPLKCWTALRRKEGFMCHADCIAGRIYPSIQLPRFAIWNQIRAHFWATTKSFGITKMLNPSQEIVDYNPYLVKVYEKHNNNNKL
jgi:hypothetical protein